MENAWESENVNPRALKAKAFASHGLTCVEIATGKPQSEKQDSKFRRYTPRNGKTELRDNYLSLISIPVFFRGVQVKEHFS